jgi:glycosyltransferase involved in cell wall biosynthesis
VVINSSNKPKISIIVPNYNHARYLSQRLDSIFNQTYQNFEVILLDDCSTDNSLPILEMYATNPKVSHFVTNEQNSGSPFRQWKKGIELSGADYIWIAESDDWAAHDFLEKLVPRLDQGYGLAYCRYWKVSGDEISDEYWPDGLDNTRWRSDFHNNGLDEIKRCLVYRNTIPNMSSCIFNIKHLVFPEAILDTKYSGDWLFWINLLRNNDLYYSSEKLNYFRFPDQSTRVKKSRKEELKRFQERLVNIRLARKISGLGKIKSGEKQNYHWLLEQYYNMRMLFGWHSILPDFPASLVTEYYRLYFKKLVIGNE